MTNVAARCHGHHPGSTTLRVGITSFAHGQHFFTHAQHFFAHGKHFFAGVVRFVLPGNVRVPMLLDLLLGSNLLVLGNMSSLHIMQHSSQTCKMK